jgi:thiamine biosynthesis lipoprotein
VAAVVALRTGAPAGSDRADRRAIDRVPARATGPVGEASAERPMMGGRVSVHLRADSPRRELELAAERVLDRLDAWANRLSRFVPGSELSRLNASAATSVRIGPTLTEVLDWARVAESITGGLVDVSMLDARLAAEDGSFVRRPVGATRRWSLIRQPRGAVLVREPGVRFDLDGVAKGWLSDRALDLAPGRTALVDGDGDIAARVAPGDELLVAVADPRDSGVTLAIVRLASPDGRPTRFGLATSGTSVHRWVHRDAATHHLIDPATWRPAVTDVVQATVLADTARAAEAGAKAAVLAGSDHAPAVLDRPGVRGLLLLTTRGEVRATAELLPWLS